MVTHEQLLELYKTEKNPRKKERLLAMCHIVINKEKYADVARMLLKAYNTIKSWHKRFLKHGTDGLDELPRSGRPSKTLNRKITEFFPSGEELVFPVDVVKNIWESIHVRCSESTVRNMMRTERFSPKVPQAAHANRADVETVVDWQRSIKRWIPAVKRAGFVPVFMDETFAMHERRNARGPWSRIGEKIYTIYNGNHKNTVIFGAITSDCRQMFMKKSKFKKDEMLAFLKQLVQRYGKVALIMDKAGPHMSHLVSDFIYDNHDRIRVRYFPTGWPELNPIESCWGTFKRQPFMHYTYASTDDRVSTMMNFLHHHRFNRDVRKFLFQKPIAKTF